MNGKSRWLLVGVCAALSLVLTACSEGEPEPLPSVYAAAPVEGEVPAQQAQIAGTGAPRAYPVLTEETDVRFYLSEMFQINIGAVKNRQPFEIVPELVPVEKTRPCYKVPGARQPKAVYKVGDKAPAASPLIAACVRDGKLVLMYAPAKFYRFYLDANVPKVRATLVRATQEYLAQLASNASVGSSEYFAECAGGRLIGGLRDGGYVEVQWANATGVDGAVDTDAERIYVDARDNGQCPRSALGYVG